MRVWQLYLDESGDFDKPNEAVLVAGVLFEGRALPQQSSAVRRRIASIFVGKRVPAPRRAPQRCFVALV